MFSLHRRERPGDDALVNRADRAMYEARSAGRNRVVLARPDAPMATPSTRPEVVDAGAAPPMTDNARD